MKKFIVFCFVMLLYFSISASDVDLNPFFEGKHDLLNLSSSSIAINTTKSSASFFLVVGSYYNETKTLIKQTINFYWKNNKGEYISAEFPKDMVRFVINNDISVPYCKFKWCKTFLDFDESRWTDNVIYVVIIIKETMIINKEYNIKL